LAGVAIGNGTASRETEALIRTLITESNLDCRTVVVSEAGASVYSASPIAIQEFPDLDVTIRGAVFYLLDVSKIRLQSW